MNDNLLAVIRRVERFVADRDDAYPLPPEAGRFVHALVRACKARRCLEIGTSYGYSTLWIAAALPTDGELISIDRSQKKHDFVREQLASAGLQARVRLLTGSAADVLPTITGPFDFVLNDADKEHCRSYFDAVSPHLTTGGLFVTDNVLSHAEPLADFLEYLRHLPGYFSTPVPVGNGTELTVKLS